MRQATLELMDELGFGPEFKGQFEANYAAFRRKAERIERALGWTRRLPFVGRLVFVFWSNLLESGVKDTLAPRWGALTFSFLNDGYWPSVWHTVYSVRHGNEGEYSGCYTAGAPRSLAEAEAVARAEAAGWRAL